MKSIKAILVDDEKNALNVLTWALNKYCPEVEVIAVCKSGEECLTVLKTMEPDVLFLDVEMPKMNGFDLLENLEKLDHNNFEIVFTTAYDKFAVRAFKYAAINYLLKPIDADDLIVTIDRIKQRSNKTINKDQLKMMIQSISNKDTSIERIAFSTNEGLIFVLTKEIVYCKAESNYTSIVLLNGKKTLVSKTLKDIDELLTGKDFFRAHKSYLININHIIKFVKGEGGYVVMADNEEITIARDRKDDFMKLFSRI